jgi:ribosomal protein L29
MNPAANVRAVEALKDWHAALAEFRTEAQDALAAVELEIRRAFDWIADTQRHWKQTVRDAEEEVVQAKAELANRRFPDFSGRMPDTSEQEKALRRAIAKQEFAERQVEVCQRWLRKLPAAVSETYEGPARQLAATLEAELPRGLAVLQQRLDALEAYLGLAAPKRPAEEPPPAPPPEGGSP